MPAKTNNMQVEDLIDYGHYITLWQVENKTDEVFVVSIWKWFSMHINVLVIYPLSCWKIQYL